MKHAFAAVALTLAASQAQAIGGLILLGPPPEQESKLSIGPSVAAYPEAPGSDKTTVLPLLGVDYYHPNGFFFSTDIGLGWNLSHQKEWQYGARLWPVFGRSDDSSRSLGLQDIGNRLGYALFANYAPWEFLQLQSNLLAGSGGNGKGVQFEIGSTLGARLASNFVMGLMLGATWANADHMRSYYGVSPEESAAGSLPAYTPGADWSDFNYGLVGSLRFNESWKLSGQWLAGRLMGDAKDSPLVRSRMQNTFSLTLWYQFK
ncbi:MipA/OmpV family protein [Sphaerotilaceae bacterium SBD11-9]